MSTGIEYGVSGVFQTYHTEVIALNVVRKLKYLEFIENWGGTLIIIIGTANLSEVIYNVLRLSVYWSELLHLSLILFPRFNFIYDHAQKVHTVATDDENE